jgi:hypothetical protein
MKVTICLQGKFQCSLERAFAAPIRGDATQFLNGYFLQPAVVGFEEDEQWGQVGGLRYPISHGNLLMPQGRIFTDRTILREENQRWMWEITDIQSWTLYFWRRATGTWTVAADEAQGVKVTYTYELEARNLFFYPATWLFAQFQWRGMMRKALKGIQAQAESDCAWVYD